MGAVTDHQLGADVEDAVELLHGEELLPDLRLRALLEHDARALIDERLVAVLDGCQVDRAGVDAARDRDYCLLVADADRHTLRERRHREVPERSQQLGAGHGMRGRRQCVGLELQLGDIGELPARAALEGRGAARWRPAGRHRWLHWRLGVGGSD